jgi:1-aminocyclopropane-1-carboxylate deaminase/D-cysteine desulfhydrase-like pyridoxal-dependent ACC family enzyme
MILDSFIAPYLDSTFNLNSRIHKLRSFGQNVFVKRDDELSSGITGSKYRKFASLLPFLIQSGFDEVLLIGSAQSNNIVGLLQLLNENAIPVKLLLLESNEADKKGNLLWINLLHDLKNVIWVQRQDWKDVNTLARNYATDTLKDQNKKVFIVEEGASVVQALPGAITLAAEILQQEKSLSLTFYHIFIDSGSATSAIGLLYGLALADISDKTIHITLIAGTESEFKDQYHKLVKEAASIYGWPKKYFNGNIVFSRSVIAPSFGSITTQVLDEVKNIACKEGILAEPVYTAKHFSTARHIIADQNLQGDILIINSGGSLGLSGFQEKLAK